MSRHTDSKTFPPVTSDQLDPDVDWIRLASVEQLKKHLESLRSR